MAVYHEISSNYNKDRSALAAQAVSLVTEQMIAAGKGRTMNKEPLSAQGQVDALAGREADVAKYLHERGTWTSPTMIGREVWDYPHHSASASPVCKRLVAKGVAMRNDYGHYMIAPNAMLNAAPTPPMQEKQS